MKYASTLKKKQRAQLRNKFVALYHSCDSIQEFLIKVDLDGNYPKMWKFEARRYHFMCEHPVLHLMSFNVLSILSTISIAIIISFLLERFNACASLGFCMLCGFLFTIFSVIAYIFSFEDIYLRLKNPDYI